MTTQPTALRLADELMDGMNDEHWNQLNADAAALRAALAEQPAEQESVAWVGLSEDDKLEILRTNGEAAVMYLTEAKLREKNAEQQSAKHGDPIGEVRWAADVPDTVKEVRWADYVAPPVGTKLYTATQPAKQPLTDEEIDALELPPSGN